MYLKYAAIQALTNNTKFYFGESIPKYLTTNIISGNGVNEKIPEGVN